MRHRVLVLSCLGLSMAGVVACSDSHARTDAEVEVPDAGLDGEVVSCTGDGPICYAAGECTEPGCVGAERWQCPPGFVPSARGSVECGAPDGGAGDGGACPADFGAAEGTPCAEDGRSCGSCIDPCGFCNLLRCEGGQWTRLEVFPPPDPCVSFDCGELRCDAVRTYCSHAVSDVGGEPDTYRCEAYPAGCSSCDCLGGDRCEGTSDTGIMVTWLGG